MYEKVKRVMDIILAVILLIIGFIPMVIIGIAIKIESKGPVFYRQLRTGKDGKVFILYKFRSTPPDNSVNDFSKADVFTKVGKFIRKTSLDELGQLINIFKGDMSFIGPRPWIPEYYEAMNEVQRHRCDVKPGITGLAQVMGRNSISIFKKIGYDLEYVNSVSFLEDLKIVFLTVKSLFTKEGVEAGKNTIEMEIVTLKNQDNLEVREINRLREDNSKDISNVKKLQEV